MREAEEGAVYLGPRDVQSEREVFNPLRESFIFRVFVHFACGHDIREAASPSLFLLPAEVR